VRIEDRGVASGDDRGWGLRRFRRAACIVGQAFARICPVDSDLMLGLAAVARLHWETQLGIQRPRLAQPALRRGPMARHAGPLHLIEPQPSPARQASCAAARTRLCQCSAATDCLTMLQSSFDRKGSSLCFRRFTCSA
jgi:hypothetical protein